MANSRIALHILTPSPATDALVRSAPWRAVKAVGNPSPLAVAAQANVPIRIFRQFGVEQMSPAGAVAAITAHDLTQVTHLQLCCEDAKGYDPAWQLAVMDGMRAVGYRGRFLVGAFPTGNPPKITGDPPHFPELEPLYSLLRRPDTDLALDCYTGLLVMDPRWAAWAPYTVFRPTLIHDDLARQGIAVNVVVTESGGDNIAPVTTGGGWLLRNWSADEYLTTLIAVDADDRTHPWLLARCIFTSGPTPDWWAFDVQPIAGALAAYVVGQAANTPSQSMQDAPQRPIGQQSAPQPVASPPPVSPDLSKGNYAVPIVPIDFRQLPGSYDCWVCNLRRFFSRYGILLDDDTVFQAGKGYHRPAGGEAADFPTFRRALETLARANGVQVGVDSKSYAKGQHYLQVLEIDAFPVLWACLNDPDQGNPWSVSVGEDNADFNPSQAWQHYIGLLQDTNNDDMVNIYDPAATWDGDASQYSKAQLAKAILDNWDSTVIGYAMKIVTG